MTAETTSRTRSHPTLSAVIVAGDGQARGSAGSPGPLTPLLGVSLLERAIFSLAEVGVSDIYVVTGGLDDAASARIERFGRRAGVAVRAVPSASWGNGSGSGALAASAHVKGPFLLLAGNQVLDAEILQLLLDAHRQGGRECLVAVGRAQQRLPDADGSSDGRTEPQVAAGNGATALAAADAGLFLCGPSLFEALESGAREGDGSLKGGVQRLIDEGKAGSVEIGSRLWLAVDTPETLSQAKKRLLDGIVGPSGDGVVSRHINRRLSRRISRLLALTPLTPNNITVLSFLIGIAGAVLFGFGSYVWTIVAGLLIQLASVVDGCDGEIARLKFRSSRYGAWFDTVLDRYADVAIAAGITFGYWLVHPHPIAWLGGMFAAAGFLLASYSKKEYALRYERQPAAGLLAKAIKRDVRLFALFVGALFNLPFETMILVGLLSHVGVGWNLLSVYREEARQR